MKKITGILIVMISCLLFACSAFAADGTELTDNQREAISILNDLNIIQDVTEEEAAAPVTRGEFAKMIVGVMGGTEHLSPSPKRIYIDIPADNEMAAYVEYLYNYGIMKGFGNAQFNPDDEITIYQAVKVVVSMLGYAEWADDEGGYPDGYYKIASNNKLVRGISGRGESQITLADAAVLIKNVLENDNYLVTTGYENGRPVTENNNGKDYMGYVLNTYKYTGIVEACGNSSLYSSEASLKTDVCRIGGELFNTGDIDVSQYLGMKVTAYYKSIDDEHKILHITVEKENNIVEVKDEDIDKAGKSVFTYRENGRTKRLSIASDAIYVYNGKILDVVADSDLDVTNGFVKFISNDDDDEYDVVIIKEFETFVVEKAVSTDSLLIFKYDRGELDLDADGNIQSAYYENGEPAEFSNITTGSVLSIAMSKNISGELFAEIYIANNKVEGSAAVLDDEGVTLSDGTVYAYTDEYKMRLEENQSNTYLPTIGNEGVFYIDYFGKLAAYTVSSASKQYGYVVKCWYDEHEGSALRLFTRDGEFKEFEIPDKLKFNGKSTKAETITELLAQSGENGTIHQLIVYKSNASEEVTEIRTAENKQDSNYYIVSDDEFVLNDHVKNKQGEEAGQRFYKNMAEDKPYCFVDGKTVHFLIPTDKSREKDYKVASKLSTTDVSVPKPVYVYDVEKGGNIGALVTNTASDGKYGTPCIVDKVLYAVNDEDETGRMIQFIGGATAFASNEVKYTMPKNRTDGQKWNSLVPEYANYTIDDLKRGDVIQYTTLNNEIDEIRFVVKSDNIGPIRVDDDNIQLNGNMVADIISVSENGRTAIVRYMNRFGNEIYQTMLVNGTVYRYDSSDGRVYNSSTSDLREGDRVLINSYWWSPKLVVIFR